MATGRFELRIDEDTGRRYWWGAEDGWKDATEIGEDGVLTINAEFFAIGTVLTMSEPFEEEHAWTENAIPFGYCARCGAILNNVSPGFSIIKGGASVCTNCLQPGEEIARARSLT